MRRDENHGRRGKTDVKRDKEDETQDEKRENERQGGRSAETAEDANRKKGRQNPGERREKGRMPEKSARLRRTPLFPQEKATTTPTLPYPIRTQKPVP